LVQSLVNGLARDPVSASNYDDGHAGPEQLSHPSVTPSPVLPLDHPPLSAEIFFHPSQ
jgi:hypothetical protein